MVWLAHFAHKVRKMDEREAIRTLLQMGQLPTAEKIQQVISSGFGTPGSGYEPVVQVEVAKPRSSADFSIEVLQHFEHTPRKMGVSDFTTYFRNRYAFLKSILINRAETEDAVSISKLNSAESGTVIAMISDIKKLPTGTLKMTIEDLTGQTSAIVSVKKEELLKKIPFLAMDEVLAFKGKPGKNIFFVDDIIWPEIPQKTHASCPDDINVAFCSDLHVGSKMFLPKEFERFVSWLRGEAGNAESQAVAAKTKYVVVLGDVVDGVGVYPEQEKELTITDIYKQYDEAAKLLQQIPGDKQILIIPGNHDALRLCEPQPPLYKDVAAPLYEIPNVTMLSNPSYIRLHKMDNYAGAELLLYHGYSFDYFVDVVEALRTAGGYDAADKLWEFLLKRRHLAPSFGSTLALPMANDPLMIRQIPDIAASGHIHKAKLGSYRGVCTISGSCFQDTTVFQQRVGHNPQPGLVPIVNLKTWTSGMLQFR